MQQIIAQHPDRAARLILYCNGPSCGKSKRTSEELVAAGYTAVQRYQLGLPVWRALSQTVQTDMPGVLYIHAGDRTAVWVDARTPPEFSAASMPGAVNVQQGEATAANDDEQNQVSVTILATDETGNQAARTVTIGGRSKEQ